MHHKFRILLALLAGALLLPLTAGPATAAHRDSAGRAGPGTFGPIVGQLDGRTGAELMADSFVPDYVRSASSLPDECQRLGKHERVVFLRDVSVCQLRPHDSAVALIGASCSDVEEPPFFAVGEAAQRACARGFNGGILSITLAVDGGTPVEIIGPRFAVSPAQRRIVIPADNAAGFPAGPATFTADGWAAALHPPTPGTHTVQVVGLFADVGGPVEVAQTFTLIVSPHKQQ